MPSRMAVSVDNDAVSADGIPEGRVDVLLPKGKDGRAARDGSGDREGVTEEAVPEVKLRCRADDLFNSCEVTDGRGEGAAEEWGMVGVFDCGVEGVEG